MGELLNLVGLSTGVVLYAVLLAMVVQAGLAPGLKARRDPLLLATAVLGLTWNVCALTVYELPRVGVSGPFPAAAAIGFSALGLLPAVVVHSVLRGERDALRSPLAISLAIVAYALSGVAALLQMRAAAMGTPIPYPPALRLLTYSFVALVVPVGLTARGQPGTRRALWIAALAVFAVSAMHLSQLHAGESAWPIELVGHNASLPLALAILYQDYPFAFADLFLKRALVLLGMVATAFAAIALFASRSDAFAAFLRSSPRQVGILVTLLVATALLYPAIRGVTTWFVDVMVLRRPDYDALRRAIGRRVAAHNDIAPLMDEVCHLLAQALSASRVAWRAVQPADGDSLEPVVASGVSFEGPSPAPHPEHEGRSGARARPAAVLKIPTSDAPRYVISLGGLTGGRRLLSDELHVLESTAVAVARRIDAIRVADERYERESREAEMRRLTTEAELRALRAQINPHFLFNALTTIGYLIQAAPPRALDTLLRLTALLRGVLRSDGELTTLGRELDIVEAYLDIEHARFEERLTVTVDVPEALRSIPLPPLLLQPIAENAVKHGIAPIAAGGEVRIRARVERARDGAEELRLVVQDTGIGAEADVLARGRTSGLGLRNVERRLHHHYGPTASLVLDSVPGAGTIVEVRLPVERRDAAQHRVTEVSA